MQREIKFRIWIPKFNSFLKNYNNSEEIGIRTVGVFNNLYNLPYMPSDEYVVQQYTGLKDKNGAEIYEGDILERIGDGSFCKIVISWNDANCAFYSKNSFNLHGEGSPISKHNINITDWTYWVVCGNIFENNELLKQ